MPVLVKKHPINCRCPKCTRKRSFAMDRRSLSSEFGDEFTDFQEIAHYIAADKMDAEATVALGAAQLGLGIFQVGQSIGTSGDLSVQADVARYVHQNTPAYIPFSKDSIEFKISAHHPRYGIDRQNFYFRLVFEYNRYDLRNVSINVLRNKSSSLYASTFSIQFKASAYSQTTDPVAQILYTMQGRWDPVGLGDVSFDGEMIIKADASARGSINSERGWVRWDGFLMNTLRRTRLSAPPRPGLVPPPTQGARPTIRSGSRGQPVIDLQTRLNRWLTSQGQQTLTVDGAFGRHTKNAVIAFQRAVRLKPDGIVGPNTWAVLVRNW